MIRNYCCFLTLGVLVFSGCTSSRIRDAKLPLNPQYAKVQTPVLHPMPVQRRSVGLTHNIQQIQPQPITRLQPEPAEPASDYIDLQPVTIPVQPTPMLVSTPAVVTTHSQTVEAVPATRMDESWITPGSQQSLPIVEPEAVTVQPEIQDAPVPATVVTTDPEPTLDSVKLLTNESDVQDDALVLLDVDHPKTTGGESDVLVMPEENITKPQDMPKAEVSEDHLVLLDVDSPPLPIRTVMQQPSSETATQASEPSSQVVQTIAQADDPAVESGEIHMPEMTLDTTANKPEIVEENIPAKPEPKPESYQVNKGDTLWSIATRFYGNGQMWLDIARHNRIRHADEIAVGMVLRLP